MPSCPRLARASTPSERRPRRGWPDLSPAMTLRVRTSRARGLCGLRWSGRLPPERAPGGGGEAERDHRAFLGEAQEEREGAGLGEDFGADRGGDERGDAVARGLVAVLVVG